MPGTTVQAFTDIDRYQESIRGARNIDLLVTGSGKFQAELTKIDLHHLWTQRGQASVSKIMHTTLTPTRSPIFFLTHQEQAHTIHNGVELRPGEILFYGRGAEHYHRFPAGTNWSAMSLTPEQLAEAGEAVTQRDLRAPITTSKIRPPARLLERLLHLNDTAARLAATMPDVIAHPEVARAIEQELMRVMVKCLTAGVVADLPGFRDLRVPVMRRFERVLEENRGRPLYMVEICAAIGVCDRMLRLRCTEELGMSPHRYLWLRRMHMARRALAQAAPGTTTVTEVATNQGFGEIGRFSVAYRKLFGETPSTTLKRMQDASPSMTVAAPAPYRLASFI